MVVLFIYGGQSNDDIYEEKKNNFIFVAITKLSIYFFNFCPSSAISFI